MLKQWLTITIIVGLVLAAALLWDTSPSQLLGEQTNATTSEQTNNLRKAPTNILFNNTHRHFDKHGQLSSELQSAESRQFQVNPKRQSDKDYTLLTRPKLTFYSPEKRPWYVIANKGVARKFGEYVELHGDVHVWQLDETGNKSELTTTFLIVKPKQKYAETDKAVKMTSPGNKTTAVGMQALLAQDLIKLLSNVRGAHEPYKKH